MTTATPATEPSRVGGPTAILLLSCPDQRGVVAAVAEFIASHEGNILHAEQHVDDIDGPGGVRGVFFQRVEFELSGFALDRAQILEAFSPVAERFRIDV